ncbi:ankyrin repeat domain-containing protein [Nannocystis sp. ILAH1]|uniref:ankyrin repeat domain-containing protein n=1 Tax=unclassified Nannocystis TaxID=2627009 RepID=UPI0022707D9E|nr:MULTISPECIES: ankyrin repeat domain-containing protein [unclassified Nannocystis]MCY0986488.1 ankyrin repeat domain-containing protein [Nannocystis sp. ILAH1]MCY1071363.1 ankyrin repeat domain-containing protein [Nannocystis sp. RBIL2]
MKKTAKAKSSASKTAFSKKAAAKKATAKAAKKTAAKKTAAKKTAAKKTAAKKSTAKKTAAKKTPGLSDHVATLRDIMADHWQFVDNWFAENDTENFRPEPPRAPKDASAAQARWEEEYGEAFEDTLKAHFAGGLGHPSRSFMEYTLLDLPLAYDRWTGLNELVDEGAFKKAKPRALDKDAGSIRFVWWSRGFIPIAEDGGGNLMCADLDPGPNGARGQIVKWEKTEGPLGPLAENIAAYLVDYRNSLQDGSLAFDESGFLERRKVRKTGSKPQEELFAAVEAGDAATVSRLLAADKSLLDVRNQYDEPLIIPAMQNQHTDVVRAFLDAGVDANTLGPSGGRILGYALSANAASIVALLLERGATPLLDGKWGTPESIIASMLNSSSFSDHAPEADYLLMLESLLRAGADPNVPWYGETPLMMAAAFGSMALVKRLLAAGARVDAVDDKGKTAAAHAKSKRRKEVAEFLAGLAAR